MVLQNVFASLGVLEGVRWLIHNVSTRDTYPPSTASQEHSMVRPRTQFFPWPPSRWTIRLDSTTLPFPVLVSSGMSILP